MNQETILAIVEALKKGDDKMIEVFGPIFKAIIQFTKDSDTKTTGLLEQVKPAIEKILKQGEERDEISKTELKKLRTQLLKDFKDIIEEEKTKITPKKGIDYFDGGKGDKGDDGNDADEGRITNLILQKVKEMMKEHMVEMRKTTKQPTPPRIISPRYVWTPWVDNFSSLTNGVTKTFYLSKEPKDPNLIKLWCSDFPNILYNGAGFSVSKKVITLADEVPAPSSGATLVAEFYT